MAVRVVHLVKRFFGSLSPVGPGDHAEAWVATLLGPGEHELWCRLGAADRRHAVAVARRTQAVLAPSGQDTPAVLAAALLHDVGKLASELSTGGRVLATLAGRATGGRNALAWSERGGLAARVGLYLRHAPLGSAMLEAAGSDPLTVAWAAEHHLPPGRWTVPPGVGRALKDADDD